mgnify:CR=1 FL=1
MAAQALLRLAYIRDVEFGYELFAARGKQELIRVGVLVFRFPDMGFGKQYEILRTSRVRLVVAVGAGRDPFVFELGLSRSRAGQRAGDGDLHGQVGPEARSAEHGQCLRSMIS